MIDILIAPNTFKCSLSADAVAEAIARGIEQSDLECRTRAFPVGDGGDGTAALMIRHLNGRTVPVEVKDPLGRVITARIGLIDDGRTAVIEMADASGLRLLDAGERDPLRANSVGTGELIRAALDGGARHIILGLGGSATVDGGAGLLQALGVQFVDSAGRTLSATPAALVDLEKIDVSGLDSRINACTLTLMCDVDNQILGETGAARVFGAQKGATQAGVSLLEAALARWCQVLCSQTGQDVATLPFGGAAGGIAAGLKAIVNAQLVSGIDYFLDTTDFDCALQGANLVITGEGSIEDQTLLGKAPCGVAIRAKSRGIPVVALAGRVPLEPGASLRRYFDVLLPIAGRPCSVGAAIRDTRRNLTRTANEVGNALFIGATMSKKDPSCNETT